MPAYGQVHALCAVRQVGSTARVCKNKSQEKKEEEEEEEE